MARAPRLMLRQQIATVDANRDVALNCGATTSRGTRCMKRMGWRTDHPGQGRCYLHGGRTPITHGRYSTIKRERIRDLIAKHEQDKDPLNLLPEIAALRALFEDYLERYEDHSAALLAWHQSWQVARRPIPEERVLAIESLVDEWEESVNGESTEKQRADIASARIFLAMLRGHESETKPRQLLDISDAHRILGEVGKMVERVENARSKNAISRPELGRVMQELWRSVDARVHDDAIKGAIREDWLRVAL